MEKKKVRIYKAHDGKGKFINKTAKFLQKAQMGGAPEQEQDMQKYMSYAYGQLKNDAEPMLVYQTLVKSGLTDEIAYGVLNKVIEFMVSRGEMDPSIQQEKQSQEPAEQQGQEEQQQMAPPENMDDQFMSEEDDSMLYPEDDSMAEEEAYASDTSHLGYQDGGEYDDSTGEGRQAAIQQYDNAGQGAMKPFDLDALIENTPGVQESLTFPGIESYIPNYQSVQWDNIDALQPSIPEQKRGGSTKKSFVKNVMALLKKQEGGDQEQTPASTRANPLDNATGDVEKRKTNFLNTVKDSATKAATETLYEKLSQSKDPQLQQLAMQQNQQQQQPMQPPMQQPMDMNQGQMQRGGGVPDWYAGMPQTMSPYQYRQYYKMMKKMMPNGLDVGRMAGSSPVYNKRTMSPLPVDPMDYAELASAMAAQLGIPMPGNMPMGPSIHVEETDMFGRPKKYWIDYNGRKSSELQADESTSKNNSQYYQHATPEEMMDSEIEYEEDVDQYPMAQMGGFTGGKNPLTRFFEGGEDMGASYYENMDLPEAQFGGVQGYNFMNYLKGAVDNAPEGEEEDVDTTVDADITPEEQVRIARINYKPNYVTTPGGFFRNLLPWNPGIGYAGSYGRQTSIPYYVGSKNPYMGSLAGSKPVAHYITKKGLLGRPKKWVDVYDVDMTEAEAKNLADSLDGQKKSSKGPRPVRASMQGLKYRLQGKDKKQFGGAATRADSLSLYENALAQDAYYVNKYGKYYQKPKISTWYGANFKDIKKEHLNWKEAIRTESSKYMNQIAKKKAKIKNNPNKNKEYILDTVTGALDWNAPLLEYDHRIKPQGLIAHIPKLSLDHLKNIPSKLKYLLTKYDWYDIDDVNGGLKFSTASYNKFAKAARADGFSDKQIKAANWANQQAIKQEWSLPGNMTDLPYYDPLAIKPSDLLTKKEVIARVDKYGTSGISKKKLLEAGIDPDKQKEKDKKRKEQSKTVVVAPPVQEISLPVRSIESTIPASANQITPLNLPAKWEMSNQISIDNYGQEYVSQKMPIFEYKLVSTEDPNMPGRYITKRVKYIAGYEDVGGMNYIQGQPTVIDLDTGAAPSYQRGGYLPRAQFGPPGFEIGTGLSMGISSGQNNCTDADKRKPGSPCYDPNFAKNNGSPNKGYSQNNPFAGIMDYSKALENPFGETSLTGNVSYAETSGIQNDAAEKDKQRNLVAVENKRKDIKSFDPEAMVNVANAGIRAGTNMINKFGNRNAENQLIRETTDVNNLYASQQPQFRGDWVDTGSQLGQYRFDQMGQDRSSYSAYGQRGGYMQTGGFTEGSEAYMTEEEIAEFIANGGELEYL